MTKNRQTRSGPKSKDTFCIWRRGGNASVVVGGEVCLVRVHAQLLRSPRVTRWNIAFPLLHSPMKILIENASSLKPSALISQIWEHLENLYTYFLQKGRVPKQTYPLVFYHLLLRPLALGRAFYYF